MSAFLFFLFIGVKCPHTYTHTSQDSVIALVLDSFLIYKKKFRGKKQNIVLCFYSAT